MKPARLFMSQFKGTGSLLQDFVDSGVGSEELM